MKSHVFFFSGAFMFNLSRFITLPAVRRVGRSSAFGNLQQLGCSAAAAINKRFETNMG
jgi:hypothetical protein